MGMNRSRRHPAAPGVQRDLQTEEGDLMADTVLAGILTNYLTIILGALAGMALLIFRLRRILRFYGIRQRQDTIRIVIPRLDVQPRGAVGATAVSKGYVGTAVAQPDYEAAVLIQEQLRPNVSARLPREVRDWISGKWALAAAVNPIIELAPALPDAQSWLRCHSETNLILLGGPVYNAVADHYLKREGAHFAFTRGAAGAGWDVQSKRGGTPGASDIIKGRAESRELAVIQRIVCKDTKASITMCSGTGAGATLAGAEWLNRKYRQLDRRCGNSEYGVVLAYVDVTDPHSRFPEGIEPKVLDQVFDGERDL